MGRAAPGGGTARGVILPVTSRWRRCILVCRPCERKLGGGFGKNRDKGLSRLLRKLAGGKRRKARFGVIASPCFKLCPKGAVTVVDGARPDQWQIVSRGTPIEQVIARLGLEGDASDQPAA